MASQPAIRVLFRMHFGLPFRQASQEEKQKVSEKLTQMFNTWKTSGIRLLGTFGSPAHVGGFAHYLLFEVDDYEKVGEMDRGIFAGEVGRYIENFDLHIGMSRSQIEDVWKA